MFTWFARFSTVNLFECSFYYMFFFGIPFGGMYLYIQSWYMYIPRNSETLLSFCMCFRILLILICFSFILFSLFLLTFNLIIEKSLNFYNKGKYILCTSHTDIKISVRNLFNKNLFAILNLAPKISSTVFGHVWLKPKHFKFKRNPENIG